MTTFTQKDYNALTAALDTALRVFQDMGMSDDVAESALENFVSTHYFKVWRAMSPRSK